MYPPGSGFSGARDEASESVAVAGPRDVRGTLDRATPDERGETVVVACPPHPQYGGSRSDPRLQSVSAIFQDRSLDCLRFDYGTWAAGTGERADLRAALTWAAAAYSQVGLFGYSFGGAVAILVAAAGRERVSEEIAALCALSPARSLPDGSDVPAAVPAVDVPAALVYGSDDDTVELSPTITEARRANWRVTELPADHHFTGRRDEAAAAVADSFENVLP